MLQSSRATHLIGVLTDHMSLPSLEQLYTLHLLWSVAQPAASARNGCANLAGLAHPF